MAGEPYGKPLPPQPPMSRWTVSTLKAFAPWVALGLASAAFLVASGMVRQQAIDTAEATKALAVKVDALNRALEPVTQLAVRVTDAMQIMQNKATARFVPLPVKIP